MHIPGDAAHIHDPSQGPSTPSPQRDPGDSSSGPPGMAGKGCLEQSWWHCAPPALSPHPNTATTMLQGTASAALSRPRCGAPSQARKKQKEEKEEEEPPASLRAAATQLAPESLMPATVLQALGATVLSPGCPHPWVPPAAPTAPDPSCPVEVGPGWGPTARVPGEREGGGCG